MKAKRMIASALVLSMLASATAAWSASATDQVTLSAEKVEAKAGSTFTLNVSLSDVPSAGIGICDFAVTYDASIVSITEVTAGAITDTGADEAATAYSSEAPTFDTNIKNAGTINVSWNTGLSDSSYWIQKDGVFMTIKGTVSADAKVGDVSEFKFAPVDRAASGSSSDKNADLLIGYLDADWNGVAYDVATSNGSVTVVGDTVVTTTVAGTTTGAPTTTTTVSKATSKLPESALYGDVNLDGSVTLADLVTFQKQQRGAMEFNAQAEVNANVDLTDPEVNAADVTALLKFLIGSIKDIPLQ